MCLIIILFLIGSNFILILLMHESLSFNMHYLIFQKRKNEFLVKSFWILDWSIYHFESYNFQRNT